MSFISKLGTMIGSKASTAAATAPKNPSSAVAKERLSVILASQRGSELLQGVDMDELQKDVLAVVRRHVRAVAQNSPVNCQVKNEGEVNLFEMSMEIDSCASRNNNRNNSNSSGGGTTMIRPATVTLNASST